MFCGSGGEVTDSCPVHSFNVTFKEAKGIQAQLRSQLIISDDFIDLSGRRFFAGVDAAFADVPAERHGSDTFVNTGRVRETKSGRSLPHYALAAAVLYDCHEKAVVETAFSFAPAWFPYVPGYLSFREGHAVLRALGALARFPDVVIYDGCGIAHPRGLGLASHMGVMTGIPSLGCAKSRLCGSCDEPGPAKGSRTDLVLGGECVGECLRTRDSVKPVFVSPGTMMNVRTATDIVLSLALKYRLPEPTRLAHNAVTEYKKRFISSITTTHP